MPGVAGKNINHPTQGSRTIKRGSSTFNHFDPFDLGQGYRVPFDIPQIGRQQRKAIHQHQYATSSAPAKAARTADIELPTDLTHARDQAQRLYQRKCIVLGDAMRFCDGNTDRGCGIGLRTADGGYDYLGDLNGIRRERDAYLPTRRNRVQGLRLVSNMRAQ